MNQKPRSGLAAAGLAGVAAGGGAAAAGGGTAVAVGRGRNGDARWEVAVGGSGALTEAEADAMTVAGATDGRKHLKATDSDSVI